MPVMRLRDGESSPGNGASIGRCVRWLRRRGRSMPRPRQAGSSPASSSGSSRTLATALGEWSGTELVAGTELDGGTELAAGTEVGAGTEVDADPDGGRCIRLHGG